MLGAFIAQNTFCVNWSADGARWLMKNVANNCDLRGRALHNIVHVRRASVSRWDWMRKQCSKSAESIEQICTMWSGSEEYQISNCFGENTKTRRAKNVKMFQAVDVERHRAMRNNTARNEHRLETGSAFDCLLKGTNGKKSFGCTGELWLFASKQRPRESSIYVGLNKRGCVIDSVRLFLLAVHCAQWTREK